MHVMQTKRGNEDVREIKITNVKDGHLHFLMFEVPVGWKLKPELLSFFDERVNVTQILYENSNGKDRYMLSKKLPLPNLPR
jgi:hypothetical protein